MDEASGQFALGRRGGNSVGKVRFHYYKLQYYCTTVISSICWLPPLSFHLTNSAKWKNSVLLTSDGQ